MADFHDLSRFLEAQEAIFDLVLEELSNGKKKNHWIWFIFPQLTSLGQSKIAKYYGINGIYHAQKYLEHPILGERLLKCVKIVIEHKDKTTLEIFGSPDYLKFHSCITLFSKVPNIPNKRKIFIRAIANFYDGKLDKVTMSEIINSGKSE